MTFATSAVVYCKLYSIAQHLSTPNRTLPVVEFHFLHKREANAPV